ncbi:MAG: hypothetical protein NWQ17_06690, partial [Polaribacter sp.]|nr:hypothetical protein [Polaribacter sp.]
MKTTLTFFKLIAIFQIVFFTNLFSAQTHFFEDAVANGTIWHNGAAEVANPKSDAVNSSSIVLQNDGNASWQETQFFPSGYTVKAGDKFFISFYNPNGAANWQLRMDLSTSGSFVQISGSDPAHHANAATGWTEVSLDLSTYVGENITKIQLYPTAGEAKSIYYDNVFVGSGSENNTVTKTYLFQEAVENGTIWHNGAAEVANPKSDSVNSSSIVLQNNGTASWQETQFFPSGYTVKAGDKFFISFYNPNGAANWQLRMDLSTSGSFVQISGSDPAHDANAATGWTEVSLDLSAYEGQNISKVQLYPVAGDAKSIYYDNVYIGSTNSGNGGGSNTQTYFYQEAVANGTIWHNGVSDVANPKSDAINTSSMVLQNTGDSGWQETQFFPSGYTVKAGDK